MIHFNLIPRPVLYIFTARNESFDVLHFHFADVFISYKWEEGISDFVDRLAVGFEERRIGYWKDDHEMHPGDNLYVRIAEGIAKCTVFVPIISEGYVSSTQGEKWCQKECAMAADQRKIIVPIQWGNTEIPDAVKLMIGPGTLHGKYDPDSGPATCRQRLKDICDAVQEKLCK